MRPDRLLWRWRERIVPGVLAIAAVASFVVIRHAADAAAQRQADHRADLVGLQVESSTTRAVAYVDAMRDYLVSHRALSEGSFSSFALGILGGAGLDQLAWVEPVRQARRARYEASIGRRITEPRGRQLVLAPARRLYYPATLITQVLAGNVPGVDLGALPQLRRVIRSSEPLFAVVATAPVDVPGRDGLFFVEAAPRRVQRGNVPGFVVVFVPVDWLEGSLGNSPGGVEIRVGAGSVGALHDGHGATTRSFTAAARRWSVLVPRGRRSEAASALAWSLLGGGLALAVLTLLLSAGAAARRRARDELVTERTQAEEERRAQLWFLESLDRINRAIQSTSDFEQMLGAVLDVVLAIFNCDRAWLIYPCDPEVSSHRLLIERTRPEYLGAFALGAEIPNDPHVAGVVRTVLASSSPVRFDPESGHELSSGLVDRRFGVRSMIVMAVYPKLDEPYMFGLHQCSHPRVWTPPEERLFQEIGRRLADALDTVLMFHDLRESERKIERSRVELAASRARVITAADDTRRRIERDLHDGVQQRLVSLALWLRQAQVEVPDHLPGLQASLAQTAEGLSDLLTEVQEISRGIHPSILSKGGIAPALHALARRAAIPVEVSVRSEGRLPEDVEVAAYYVVAEAVANVIKHAGATGAVVSVSADGERLQIEVRDDGIGGADPRRGSGLIGLTDRVEALGGKIHIASAEGAGTTVHVTLALEPASRVDVAAPTDVA